MHVGLLLVIIELKNGVYYSPDDPFWEEMKGIMQAYVAGPEALMSHFKAEVTSGRRLKKCAWFVAIVCVLLLLPLQP
jgi:hypothetical protein